MRGFAQGLLLVVSLGAPSALMASNNGVYLPPAPSGAGGEDSIETAEGTRCRQSINSSGAYLDVGMAGSTARPADATRAIVATEPVGDQALAYARVTIPLGRRPQRLDCSRLYELEIQRLRREVELLRMSAE